MIQVTDQRYLDQINEPFRGSFSAEVKLFFKGGTRTFTDDDIFTISESETANIVADENPTQSTEITLSNYNHEFDINGTSGYFRDISDGIECQYRFGFHVIDEDGSDDIVWLDWKRRWCSGEASLAEKQITFTVTDVFSTNDDDIEGYMSANYGLIVTNVFNKSTYPHQENGTIGVDFDVDLTNTVMYYQPTYTSFNEIIQSVAFASGKQFYIDHKGVVHIDDDRTTPTGVHLGIGDYFEDNEAGKEKKVKRITVSYYVPEDSTVDARPDFVREMNGTGESVTVSNDFICSLEDGNRVMSYLVNYYEKRGTFECTFRGDPRLEPLDVITIDILNSDETVQTVTGTIISVENTYDGTFESTIECRYVTTDTTDDTASITGAENFVYPLDSNTPSPASVTLTCTTSINNPTNYVWEYYNMVTSAWTQIGTSSTLTIPYNTEWLSDDVTTTFRCTVDDRVSASVGIKRVYTHATYTYLGIQQTAPSNPTTGDYYLAPSGLVYLWNGQEWVTTTRSDLLINAVADGKTLTGIESTPLGQLIASMQGADGQPGADGKPGADGQPGTDGVSVTGVTSYYLATSQSSGVTTETAGWTDTIQTMTETNKYLWTYQVTSFSDGHTETSTPYITGVYGDKGEQGEQGEQGQQGADGAPAKSLILTADSYNFHTDSEGNVKPDQTITITVQKQNVLDDIVWSDNKSINVPANTMKYEFKSSVGENKFVPANLLANAKRYSSLDGEPQETGYLSNDDGSLLVQDYSEVHLQGIVKDNVITMDGSNIKCVNIPDGTYGITSGATLLIMLGLIGIRKLYVAFESNDNIIPTGYLPEDDDTPVIAGYTRTGNRWSHILSYIMPNPTLIYSTLYILRDTDVALPPSITLTKPIVIDITAYQEDFTKIGLSTDEEIRAYLDTIPYEDFVEPTYSDTQLPTNISKDIVFNTSTGEAGKIVSNNPYPMTGGELNTSRGDLSSQLTAYTVIDPRDDYSNYDYVASGTIGIIADASLVNFSHTIYIRMDSSVRMDGFMQMVCTSNNEGGNIGNAVLFDFKKSKVGVFSTIGNASLPPNDEGFYSFFFTLPYVKKDDELVIASLGLRDVIIVDVDANRDTFDSLGLTTNDEIKDYLDCVEYKDFGTSVKSPVATDGNSSITAINPALDGTPTIFTVTAGDLSDSVQIGYVQDGNQGEAGNAIDHIDTFYLATSQGSGVTVETAGWTKEPQTITSEKKYLWIYQDIYYTDNTFERVDPYITGAYGDKGDSGSAGTPTMVTLAPSSVTYELSSRNVIQKQQVITVEARISGGTGTPTWTITPTEADGYTTGKDTNTVTITLPVGSSLTGFSVKCEVTDIGEDVVYINGTPVGEPTIRFFEQRASAPTTGDNNGEPFITGDYYVTNDGVPMMYEEISNSWRQPNNGDKYYDQIMTNIGNWWLSKGNDITTTTAALYGYFRTIYSNNAIIDQLSVAGIRLQEGGIIQSTVTLPDGTVRGYEPGDGETYGTTGFYLSADGTAEFYNMSAFGIFAKGSFQADAMVTGEGTSAITQSNLYSQYQSDWVSRKSYQQITNTSSYSIGDVYSMNISPDDTYAFWTSVSFSNTYKNVYAYAMGIGDTTVSATRLTGIENAIEVLSSTNYERVSRSVAIRRNGNGYQAVVAGGVSNNYTQRITVIDTTSATATATTHEYTKTNNPVQFVTIPIFTETQLLLYNAGSGVDLSSFGNYAEYQIGIADLQSDGGNYSFSWGASSAQSGDRLWGKGTEFEIADIQNTSSIGGVYDAVNGRVWIWLVGNGKMFPTEFTSTNWRQGARFRQNDYTWDGTTPIQDDFNDIKTSTYNDYIATDNGMTVITYGNNTAWEIIKINENNAWSMLSIDFGSTRYGFMGWDGTYIYGKNLSTNQMYRGTENEWGNKNPTPLGYTITSNIVGKYLVDGDILSWSSNVKRTTHGQRMDNIISFFSQLLPKINPSTMSHMPESEPLASVTTCTGNVKIAGVNKTIVRMGCSSSTLTIDTNSGSYVYKSGVLYDDTETVEITSLTISAKAASINTKTILPQDNNLYDIGSSGNVYRTIYCTTLFANQLGSGSDKVYRIYADYIGESSNKTTTIYTSNLYLGSYSRSTTGYTPLPNGLLLQWGRVSGNRSGGDYDPYNWHYPRTFGQVYFAASIYEKGDGTRDSYSYGFIYTGTAHTTWNPASDGSNGLTNSYATFATWSEFPVYFFAIGTY